MEGFIKRPNNKITDDVRSIFAVGNMSERQGTDHPPSPPTSRREGR
jgi:hypothetical protein